MKKTKGKISRKQTFHLKVYLLILLSTWLAYIICFRIPAGPKLPPQPEKTEYSKEVQEYFKAEVDITEFSQNPDKAIAYYDKAIAIDPTCDIAYANKAIFLMDKKDYIAAAACYVELNALRPRAAEYYVGKAFCQHKQGMENAAEESLRYALSAYNYRLKDKKSDIFWNRLNRALVLNLMGRKRTAKKELLSLKLWYKEFRPQVNAMIEKFNNCSNKHGDCWVLAQIRDVRTGDKVKGKWFDWDFGVFIILSGESMGSFFEFGKKKYGW